MTTAAQKMVSCSHVLFERYNVIVYDILINLSINFNTKEKKQSHTSTIKLYIHVIVTVSIVNVTLTWTAEKWVTYETA